MRQQIANLTGKYCLGPFCYAQLAISSNFLARHVTFGLRRFNAELAKKTPNKIEIGSIRFCDGSHRSLLAGARVSLGRFKITTRRGFG